LQINVWQTEAPVRISTASGSERAAFWVALAIARGTDPVSLPVQAIAIRSKFQGREFRLTNVEGVVVKKLVS
jgi:hypothetical protein